MKKLAALLFFFSCSLMAQDTIRFRNGEVKAVKVNEITDTEIKYNRFDNLTGPAYIAEINEVKSIRYKNGSVDTFTITPVKPESETPAYVNNVPSERSFQKINIVGKTLYYDHHGINNKALFSLIQEYPDKNTQNILIREFALVKDYKRKQGHGLAMLWGGVAVAVVSLMSDGGGASGAFFALGSGVSIAGGIISKMNRNKHNAQRVKVAKIYNGENYNFK